MTAATVGSDGGGLVSHLVGLIRARLPQLVSERGRGVNFRAPLALFFALLFVTDSRLSNSSPATQLAFLTGPQRRVVAASDRGKTTRGLLHTIQYKESPLDKSALFLPEGVVSVCMRPLITLLLPGAPLFVYHLFFSSDDEPLMICNQLDDSELYDIKIIRHLKL